MEGNNDLAQIFYAAQMEAMKGGCDCTVCQLIRQGSEALTAQILAGNQGNGAMIPGGPAKASVIRSRK